MDGRDKPGHDEEKHFRTVPSSVQPLHRRLHQQLQHNAEQLVLRRNSELVVGAFAVGQGRMDADVEISRDRLRAEAGEDAQAHLFFPAGQAGEGCIGGEQRAQVLASRVLRGDRRIEMAGDHRADCRRDPLQPFDLRAREPALRGDAIEIHVEAGGIDPDRGGELVDDVRILEEQLAVAIAVHPPRESRQQDRRHTRLVAENGVAVRIGLVEMAGIGFAEIAASRNVAGIEQAARRVVVGE